MNKLWDKIKNISVVLIIIISTIQIIDWINKENLAIETTCKYSEYFIPDFINDSLSQFESKITWYKNGSKYDSLFFSNIETAKPRDLSKATRNLLTHLSDEFPTAGLRDLNSYDKFYTFTITNKSESVGKNLVLEIPSARGWYELFGLGDIQIKDKFLDKIQIGSLRPKNTIIINAWSYIYSIDEDRARVTTDNGSYPIIFSRDAATGFPKWVADNEYYFSGFPLIYSIFMLLLGIFLIAVILYGLFMFVKEKFSN